MVKICPSCHAEFLDFVSDCVDCQVALADEQQKADLMVQKPLLDKEQLLQEETIPLLEGSLSHCREIEKIFHAAKLNCVVYPKSLCDAHESGALGTSCDMKYMVLIRPADLELAKEALASKFSEQVRKEGQGDVSQHAIDLSHDVITCPACGETNALKEGECPVCGLCLAVSGE